MPFDSTRKFSLVAVEHPVLVDTVRIYVKGAPEVVLGQCSNHYDADGSKVPFEEHDDVKEMMKTKMTSLGHRAIAFAYKDIDVSELASMGSESWYESLTFLGLVALHDPLRVSVKDQLKAAKDLHTNVRLISGDNFDTCKAVALDTGLVARKEEFDEQDTILEGAEFR
jgi:P-type Ca2+ transporter type 2C